jgi:uncharacterized Tic20 family protein
MTEADLPTTSEERTSAVLAWVLGIFTGFIGPLILFLVKKEKSRFAGFHALQALFWHIAYVALMVPVVLVAIAVGVSSAVSLANAPHSNEPPTGLIAGMIVFWLVLVGMGLVNLVVQVVFAVLSGSGKWTRLPLLGSWAWKLTSPAAPSR